MAALIATPALASDDNSGCGTYPPTVFRLAYSGMSACEIHKTGEMPLWHGLTNPYLRQQMRFTFTDGHGHYTRIIDFDELADGTGTIRLRTLDHDLDEDLRTSPWKKRHLTIADVVMINQLGSSTGAWDYALGSWDNKNGDGIFVHCETLDMERVNGEGYRYSSVNISCNQPQKLMPLVKFITQIAGLKPSADGLIY